jgi:hypothetical protein
MEAKVERDALPKQLIEMIHIIANVKGDKHDPPVSQYPPAFLEYSLQLGADEMYDRVERNNPG